MKLQFFYHKISRNVLPLKSYYIKIVKTKKLLNEKKEQNIISGNQSRETLLTGI